MAISTYKVYLMDGGTGTNASFGSSALIDIKEFPDFLNPPEMLDTTTLSDSSRTYIPGIQETEAMTFTANYTKAGFAALNALKGVEHHYGIFFGGLGTTNATDGYFTFKGILTPSVNGGGVNEVVDMTITIAPTTVIEPHVS